MSSDPHSAPPPMDCQELSRSLDSYLDGELAEPEHREADAHLGACETCRRTVEQQARLRTAIKGKLRVAMAAGKAGEAPAALRARIRQGLDAEQLPLWRRALSPVPVAALAACCAGAFVVFATHAGPDPLVDEAVRKHARDLPLEVVAANASADPVTTVASWLKGKVDFNAAPPAFHEPGVRLVGARLSHISDHTAAYVRYDLPRGHRGSLFILDDPDDRFGEVGHAVRVGPGQVRMINARGFNVAIWRRNEIVYSMVSDLEEPDLVELVSQAQGFRPPRAAAPPAAAPAVASPTGPTLPDVRPAALEGSAGGP